MHGMVTACTTQKHTYHIETVTHAARCKRPELPFFGVSPQI